MSHGRGPTNQEFNVGRPNVCTRLKALVEKTHLKTESSTSRTRRRQPKMAPRYLTRNQIFAGKHLKAKKNQTSKLVGLQMVIGCKERHILPLVGLPQKPKSCLKTPRVVGCKIFKRVEGIMRVEEVILNVVGLPSVVGDKDKYQCG
ncbi:hypothetical protein MTR_2g088103 [Medicago truncatula]|uniref:Uncharacterized protein n=1 Tax=Medicago truncatula TaxID=3880 RepID=A0A072VBL7_MEDTR|nr:hypothetical protein MTR_2g088103 [Medicago truncatula]